MSHFKRIMHFGSRRSPDQAGSLFSVPSLLRPHDADRVRVEVGRFQVGTIGIGEVISSGHDTQVTEPVSATLIVPRYGRIVSAEHAGTEQSAAGGGALLFSPNRRRTRVERAGAGSFLGITVTIPRHELQETARRLGLSGTVLRGLDSFALSLTTATAPKVAEIVTAVQILHEDAASGQARLLRTPMQLAWSGLLIERLVELLDHAGAIELPAASDGRASGRHVRRALDYMHAHYGDIETLADVADACGISLRTLEASFREIWSLRPLQVLTEIRLAAARRCLAAAVPSMSVTTIASSIGFSHPGRFAAAYRARFDETPSQTLTGMRRQSASGFARQASNRPSRKTG